MNRALVLWIIVILSGLVLAQNDAPATGTGTQQPQQPAAAAPASSPLQPGSLIYAELSKSLDAKKVKVGDPVMGKVTQAVLSRGKVVIPKNTKIVGHVTAAKVHTKEQAQSEIGIAFDRAELKDGTQVPLTSATVQALANPAAFDQGPSSMAGGMGSAEPAGMPGRTGTNQGGNMGGMSSPMGGSPYPSNPGIGSSDETTGTGTAPVPGSGKLNAGSRGVVGMSGVKLQSQPQGALVTQDGKNLKLDGGTQMVLRTQ